MGKSDKPIRRELCGARKKNGDPCGLPAGYGTEHRGYGPCKHHMGNTPSIVAIANKAKHQDTLAEAVKVYGLPVDTDPHQALADELHRTAGHVAWLQLQVAELDRERLTGPVGGGPESYPRYEPNVLITMYQTERAHLVRVAKTCIEAGIEERRVRMIEQRGQLLAGLIGNILADLGVSKHPDAPRVVRSRLHELAALTNETGG